MHLYTYAIDCIYTPIHIYTYTPIHLYPSRIHIGGAMDSLRKMLMGSELLSVLNNLELIGRGRTLTFLSSFSSYDAGSKQGQLESDILKSGLASYATELEGERKEQGRYWSEEKRNKALKRFVDKAQLVAALPSVLGFEERGEEATTAIMGELLVCEPKLTSVTSTRLQDQKETAAKAAKKAAAARSKRGKDDAGPSGNTPDAKRSQGVRGRGARGRAGAGQRDREAEVVPGGEDEAEEEAEEVLEVAVPASAQPRNLADIMRAAKQAPNLGALSHLTSGGGSSLVMSSSAGATTPLNQYQSLSDPTKLHELEGEVKGLTATLAEARIATVQAESARSLAESESVVLRTALAKAESQLQITSAELQAKTAALVAADSRAEAKNQNMDDLRHSQAMWSSMFMTGAANFDAQRFTQLMGINNAAKPSHSSGADNSSGAGSSAP
jgi:hypothetical protein